MAMMAMTSVLCTHRVHQYEVHKNGERHRLTVNVLMLASDNSFSSADIQPSDSVLLQ